ncbi:MAG: ATPase [Ruminococcus sp.]|nr:ATPase [Ruminococcus sp.]
MEKKIIQDGKAVIGIEFGSTRIKAVLIGISHEPMAYGVHDWQNQLADGVWTYSDEAIKSGLQACFADLMKNVEEKFGVKLTSAAAMGISAMMHGYLPFGSADDLLVPFRTWRNTMTEEAADRLTEAFDFNIPQRWSVAHLYQAILNKEPHIGNVRFITTLAGYVHFLLTDKKLIGTGDASGMFPIDPNTCGYDMAMAEKFTQLVKGSELKKGILEILPEIVSADKCAGTLTEKGALLLDPTGTFKAGVPLCPPEGDAQTGMAATNSITPRTGNVSAGTSIFSMAVLEKPLSGVHTEIDTVTTPEGAPVAMVHCNNCTTDLDQWVNMFGGLLGSVGNDMPKGQLYDKLYDLAAKGDPDCGGIVTYNCFSGEPVIGLQNGRPMMIRTLDSQFTIENLMRSLVYSCMAALKSGMDILTKEENVKLEQIYAHGGLFKTPVPSQNFLAAALETDVTLMEAAGEGGAWGIALLAAYMAEKNDGETLRQFLAERVFADMKGSRVSPKQEDIDGMNNYMKLFREGLEAERAAALNDMKRMV